MTAKEELSRYECARERVEETLEEYQKYKERAEKMTAIMSDMPKGSGGKSDKVGDNGSAMADLSRQYEERWIKAEQERLYITDRISVLKNPYREILKLKYIEGLKLEEIACKKYKSYDRVKHIHREALERYGNYYRLERGD
jgi:DNA-directed RNA polymerase specialized sigma24 family protein